MSEFIKKVAVVTVSVSLILVLMPTFQFIGTFLVIKLAVATGLL